MDNMQMQPQGHQQQVRLRGDERLVVQFKHHPVKNENATREAGRPIFDDMEVCEIRIPGARAVSVFPATAVSHKAGDSFYGTEEFEVTYAERFSHQYRQFKNDMAQTIRGTPLAHAPFLTQARRAELRALNIYTVEQLAHMDGEELKALGLGGRDLKNSAQEYMTSSQANASNLAQEAELLELRARNQVLEDDNKLLRQAVPQQSADQHFDDMEDAQLRDFIKAHTGSAPKGEIPRKTLIRMAREATQKVA